MDVDIKSSVPLPVSQIIEPITIQEIIEPIKIGQVQNIAPVAAHIKEVNHIDPISIDALHVTEVKNIEPINVEKFNVTNLPMVNVSLRQMPPVEMALRRLPPLSVGTHQSFEIPSHYTLRARLFGIEFFRVLLNGHSTIVPIERYRQEQERSPERSFPLTATAGNPAIPTICHERSVTVHCPTPSCDSAPIHHSGHAAHVGHQTFSHRTCGGPLDSAGSYVYENANPSGCLHAGLPAMDFHMPDVGAPATYGGSSVSSGG